MKEALGKPREWCNFKMGAELQKVEADLSEVCPQPCRPPTLAVCDSPVFVVSFGLACIVGSEVDDAGEEVGKGWSGEPVRRRGVARVTKSSVALLCRVVLCCVQVPHVRLQGERAGALDAARRRRRRAGEGGLPA